MSAFELVLAGDPKLFSIVGLSLLVTLSATVLACVIGMPLGALVGLTRFPGRPGLIVVLNGCMGLPLVVVGLLVYLLLSRSGPLGSLGLLFTPKAMVIAQAVLVMPIVAALGRQVVEDLWVEYRDELPAMGVGPAARIGTLLWDAPLLARHHCARRLRPGGGGGRRRDDRGRQHRRLHAHDDYGDRAGDLERAICLSPSVSEWC